MSTTDPRDDQQLVKAINAGDDHAFDAVYWRYRDWIVRLARRFTGNDDDALDVLQETFAYFTRKFPGFVLTAKLTTFFYPVVKNLSIAQRKKRGRFLGDNAALDTLAADGHVDYDHARAELTTVLATLADGQREAVLMRFVDGMSLDEIADALSIPIGTVKSRLHNALETLRNDPRTREFFEMNLGGPDGTEEERRML